MKHHLAIMRKSWGLLEKIRIGEKTVESRWYESKKAPWGKIEKGDLVWFKNSGEKVCLKAEVKKVEEYAGLDSDRVMSLLSQYGKADGIETELGQYWERFRRKRYAIFVHLMNVSEVEPFEINKAGYGAMSAWLVVNNINEIRRDAN